MRWSSLEGAVNAGINCFMCVVTYRPDVYPITAIQRKAIGGWGDCLRVLKD